MESFCEHGNDPSGCIKVEEFLKQAIIDFSKRSLPINSTLKMKQTCFSETLACTYKTTLSHNTEHTFL